MSEPRHRLILVAGKGGVGKTTVTAALGLASARLGRRTLVAEVGDVDGLGPLLFGRSLKAVAMRFQPKLWGARIDPLAELSAYVQRHVGGGFLGNRITGARLFASIAEATPGLREVMTLGRVWRWERARDENAPPFDQIIVDAPATGHGLGLLRQPRALADMLQSGPLVHQLRSVQGMLTDPKKTLLLPVTLAEELPVNETVHLIHAARKELEMHIDQVVINAAYPERFTEAERKMIRKKLRMIASEDSASRAALDAARLGIRRREMQRAHIRRLSESLANVALHHIPFMFTDPLGPPELDAIADLLTKDGVL